MKDVETEYAPDLWQRNTGKLPTDQEIDVFYVNADFDPPSSGVLAFTMVLDGACYDLLGGCVLEMHVMFWKISVPADR